MQKVTTIEESVRRTSRPRIRLLLPILVLSTGIAVALGDGVPAMADGPARTYGSQQITTPVPLFPPGQTCAGFTPLITVASEYNIIDFYDDSGRLVKQIRHVSFTGTIYNSTDLSKSVPYDGHFTRTFDLVENSVTFTGLHFRVHAAGEGVRALDVGRVILDLASGAQTFGAGNHNSAHFNADICSLLG
jgi:hypothetical protein